MPKDFAGRNRTDGRKRKPRKVTPRKKAQQRILFHGPSFGFGALVGAAIVILTAYGPEFLTSSSSPPADQPPLANKAPLIDFEFDEMLKNSEVKSDPKPYAVPEQTKQDALKPHYLQAASFRKNTDAEKLRANLILDNLPARTTPKTVDGTQWYRVIVGPFSNAQDASRALNRLRERGLAATPVNDPN